jgi:hypothetical protein
VERGDPTSEEIAALVVALAGRARAVPAQPAGPRLVTRWRAGALPGPPLRPGPGAWRASALPMR